MSKLGVSAIMAAQAMSPLIGGEDAAVEQDGGFGRH